MSIFRKIKQAGTSGLYQQLVSLWGETTGLSSGTNQKAMIEAYRGWVYACCNKNAGAVASGELILYHRTPEKSKPKYYVKTGRGSIKVTEKTYESVRHNPRLVKHIRKGMEIEEIPSHPFIDLMEQVNPFRNEWDLKFETCMYQELTGNCYWYLVDSGMPSPTTPGRKIPAEIWSLQSDKIKILPSQKEFIRGYEMTIGANKQIFTPQEIVHFRYPNPESMFYGMSPLTAAAYAVDIETSKKKYIFNFFKNFAMPPVVMKLAFDPKTMKGPSWTKEDWDLYRKSFMRNHAGPDNAGKMALLQGGLDIQNVGFSPKEFFHLVNNKPSLEEIAAIYGVPMFKLTGEGTDNINAERGDYSYMKDTITPKLKQIEQKINEQIIPLYDKNLFVAFNSVIPEDKTFELDEQKSLVNIAMTVNEVRSARGLEPVDNGDGLYMPSTSIPLGQITPPETPQDEPGDDIPDNVIDSIADYISKALPPPNETFQNRIARKYEPEVAEMIDSLMREFQADIDKRIKDGATDPDEVLAGVPDFLKKSQKEANILRKPYIESGEAALDQIKKLAKKRGKSPIQGSFDIYSADALEQLAKLDAGFSTYFSESAGHIRNLQQTLSDGYIAGESMEQLSDRVSLSMGLVAEDQSYIATRIARTETQRAANYGAVEGWNQSGLVEGKEWDAAWDACPLCAPLHGQQVKLNQSFSDGSFAPPDPHPNSYDKETEVYTSMGWKLISDVKIGDYCISLNPDNFDLEYVPVIKTYEHQAEDMIHFTNRGFDLMVTPDHNIFYQTRWNQQHNKGTWGFVKANALLPARQGYMYRSSKWKGSIVDHIEVGGEQIPVDIYAEFMGWYLSEGSTVTRKDNQNVVQSSITQSQKKNPDKYERIAEVLEQMPFKWCPGQDRFYCSDKRLTTWLRTFGKSYVKFVPDNIKSLPADKIRIFLDAYIGGDGSKRESKKWKGGNFKPYITIATSSPKMAGDIGELLIKVGRRPSYRLQKAKGKIFHHRNGDYASNHDIWIISECYSQMASMDRMKKEIIQYNDTAFCVDLEKFHTLLTRRNGKVVWSGNCRCTLLPMIFPPTK